MALRFFNGVYTEGSRSYKSEKSGPVVFLRVEETHANLFFHCLLPRFVLDSRCGIFWIISRDIFKIRLCSLHPSLGLDIFQRKEKHLGSMTKRLGQKPLLSYLE